MPRKAKTFESDMGPGATAPRGAKTAAVRKALRAYPEKGPKEISEMLQAQGFDATPGYVSTIKTNMKGEKKAKADPAPQAEAPTLPKDAVSVSLLQKAKKLAIQLGGIKEAKAAMDALAQILD